MQRAVFLIWIFLAVSSVFMPEVYALSAAERQKVEIRLDADSEEENEDPHQLRIQIDRTISSLVQIGFQPGISLAFELPFISENTKEKPTPGFTETSEYFRTLFHFIISPNAP